MVQGPIFSSRLACPTVQPSPPVHTQFLQNQHHPANTVLSGAWCLDGGESQAGRAPLTEECDGPSADAGCTELRFQEEGSLRMLDGKCFPVRQKYVWRLLRGQLSTPGLGGRVSGGLGPDLGGGGQGSTGPPPLLPCFREQQFLRSTPPPGLPEQTWWASKVWVWSQSWSPGSAFR